MIKRAFWFGAGLGVGLGGSYWMSRVVRQTAERYTPQRLGADIGESVRVLALDVVDALREGRAAMRTKEAELRAERDEVATVSLGRGSIEATLVEPASPLGAPAPGRVLTPGGAVSVPAVPAVPSATAQSRRDARRRARRTRR